MKSELEQKEKDEKSDTTLNLCLFCERGLESSQVYFCSRNCEKGHYAKLSAMEQIHCVPTILPKLTESVCKAISDSVKSRDTRIGLCERCGELSTNLQLDRIAYREIEENVVVEETEEETVVEKMNMSRIDVGFFCEDCLKLTTHSVETTMQEYNMDRRNDVANVKMIFGKIDLDF